MTSYIISGPPNFPKSLRRCYDEDANDAIDCWHSIDMALTAQARSDDYGYGSFSFMATDKYLGVFTIVIAVGHSQSGIFSGPGPQSNEFSQTFEIEVVPFRALTSCNNVDSIIAAQTPALAPFLKYYNQCPARNPDGSCVWESVLCPTSATILVLKDDFLGDPLPACIPLGTVFPSAVTATVQNDMGQPISGHSLHLSGGAQSASLALHPSVSAASDAAGLAVTNKVVLDYAEPGLHTLQFRLKLDGSPFEAASVESQAFRVTDQVVATFVQQPPASLVMGRVIAPTIQVQLRIKRKCFSNVVAGAGHHTWNPPVMVLHASLVQVGPASNNFTRNRTLAQKWDARSSIVMSGAEVTPTFTPENMFYGIATANFTALQIESGMQGLYQLHVSVKGSSAVLANSLHFELQRFARTLHLLDPVPKYPNSDNTLILRVRADSNSGDPVSSAFILAKIEVRHKEDGRMAGMVINDDRNMTAELDSGLSRGVTGEDGVATFSIVFTKFVYPGLYVLRFMHDRAPDLYSSTFQLVPPVKELQMMTNPAPDITFPAEIVWIELQAATFPVTAGYESRKIPVLESPANMKGSIKGEHIDDVGPVIRVLDHRGFAQIGLDFNVTIVDHMDNILDQVVSASRGERLPIDLGLSKDVSICGANDTRWDCDGLYSFEALATGNRLKSGFYRFRFECEGLSIVQETDLLFMNEYMPNILRLDWYMWISTGTCGVCLLLFQFNRLDTLVFQKFTAKYLQSPEERVIIGVLGTAALCVFGWFSFLFYTTLRQSKLPPHVLGGVLLPTDLMSTYSVYALYIVGLVCCVYSFFVMSQRRETFQQDEPEKFLKKLGMSSKVAEARRRFLGQLTKHIDKPPVLSAPRGRLGKKLEKYKAKLRELAKVWKVIYNIASVAYTSSNKAWVTIKYSNPAFKSLYFAWPDVFYGIRFRSAFVLNTLLVLTSCLVGLWFGEKFSAILTKYYGTYMQLVLENGSKNIDWFDEIWTNKMDLGTVQQVTVIFHARTAKLGQPFFWKLLSAFRWSSLCATVTSTLIILVRIVIMGLEQRTTMCNLRRGKVKQEIGNVKGLVLIDGCAYMGSQAVLMLFGWFTFYVFVYCCVFFLAWDSTSYILMQLALPLMMVSLFMYLLSWGVARVRLLQNPGLTIVGRGPFAFAEFVLLFANMGLGPFLLFTRFMIAVTRTVMTWFLLHNKLHEVDEVSGLGNGMYKSAMYTHHVHNNPVARALVERLHVELRNMDTMRRFPLDNIEPARLKKEIAENKARKLQRRTIARMLLLLLMRANDHKGLKGYRKQHLLLYKKKLRKGVFAGEFQQAEDDDFKIDPTSLALVGGAADPTEMVLMEDSDAEDDGDPVPSELDTGRTPEDVDEDEPESGRKSTRRSLSLGMKFPSSSGRGKKKKKAEADNDDDDH